MVFINFLNTFLGSTTGIILILTIGLTVFARVIIKIFNMGVNFRTKLATKEDQNAFEESIRRDLRNYKEELQRSILETCMRTIERELSNIDNIKKTAQDMKTESEIIKMQISQMDDRFAEIRSITDTVRQMNSRLTRLEYGNSNTDRRSE